MLSSLRTVNFSETAKQGRVGEQDSTPLTYCAVTQNPTPQRRAQGLRAQHAGFQNRSFGNHSSRQAFVDSAYPLVK